MKRNRKIGLIVLCMVLMFSLMGAGYAAWTQGLTVSGTVSAEGTFAAGVEKVVLLEGEEETVLDFADGVFTLDRVLSYPGDACMVRVYLKNTGSVAAELTAFSLTSVSGDITLELPDTYDTGLVGLVFEQGDGAYIDVLATLSADLGDDDTAGGASVDASADIELTVTFEQSEN
ncbi:MAG: hypothetical protein LBL82_08580 [Oscillospiraceae bacterium]|jgi:hypothetical protein|nr:hypothetical protein [Oscillospiraceae bacterium]